MSTYIFCLVSSTVKVCILEMGQVCPSDTQELKFSPTMRQSRWKGQTSRLLEVVMQVIAWTP